MPTKKLSESAPNPNAKNLHRQVSQELKSVLEKKSVDKELIDSVIDSLSHLLSGTDKINLDQSEGKNIYGFCYLKLIEKVETLKNKLNSNQEKIICTLSNWIYNLIYY